MSPICAADALVTIPPLIGIVFLWKGPLRWIAIDWARNSMFAARDRLFDEAAAGAISFDDPGYQAIRTGINNTIRSAHAMSLMRLFFHIKEVKKHSNITLGGAMRHAAFSFEDDGARQVAIEVVGEAERASVMLLFFKSPILATACIFYKFGFRVVIRTAFQRKKREKGIATVARMRPVEDYVYQEAAWAK